MLLHVSVSIFGDFASVLGQGKQVWLFFFTSQCLYLEILCQCWSRGSKLDYSSSRLSVYIWRLYVSVGAGKQVWLFFFTSQCLYLEILHQCWGRESKFDYSSSRLIVGVWRFCVSVGAWKASLNILLHVSVSIFGDFVSVLGHGKQVWIYFFMSQCLYLEILRWCWGSWSKLDYSSSRLSVYIWKFCVSVGAGEASLAMLFRRRIAKLASPAPTLTYNL
jgi:hypothetical protein